MLSDEDIARIREGLTQLRELSTELNEATDAAGATICGVEEFLNDDCSTGTWARIERKPSPKDADDCTVMLGYDRVGGSFRIVAHLKRPDAPGECKPWVNCNRETKLKSFGLLPGLLHLLAQEEKALCAHVQQTKQIVHEVTGALRAS